MVRLSFPWLPICVLPALALLAGCGGGGGTTVTGTVMYNGQPVEKGYVNFFPADGTSASAGGDISGGKFTVANVSPGKNKIVVASHPKGGTAHTTMGDPKKPNAAVDPDAIKPNDTGNSQVVDVAEGKSDIKLDIHTARSSDGSRVK